MLRKALFATLALAPRHDRAALPRRPRRHDRVRPRRASRSIPLAWLIGEATEHAAEHTGPGIGGFLNATFGNAPELIIALLAVHEGLTEVVRGSLTGSVVGNLLLVLGLLAPRRRPRRDRPLVDVPVARPSSRLTTALLLIPSVPSWDGDPDRDELARLSVPISIVLLVVYLVVDVVLAAAASRRCTCRPARSSKAWSFRLSLAVLGVATVATALVAEVLVGSLETFADQLGLSEFFVAAVIVAIVGNAAEHGGAVLVAYRGKIKLAAEIALASSAQVAVFLIPAVALLSWLIDPLALSFRPVEIAALGASTALVAIVLANGRSSRLKGVRAARRLRARRDRRSTPAGDAPTVAAVEARPSAAERRRMPRERVRREGQLHDIAGVVTNGAHELARARAPRPRASDRRRPARSNEMLRPAGPPTSSACSRPCAQENTTSSPSVHQRPSSGSIAAGTAGPTTQGSGTGGNASSAAHARSSASASSLGTGAAVRQHGGAGPLGAMHAERGQEPGHRARVAREDTVTAAEQLQSEPPTRLPALLVDHRLHPRHLVQHALGEHAVGAGAEEVRPAREVAGGRPEPAGRAGELGHLRVGLDAHTVGVRLDEVRGRVRRGRVAAACGVSPSGSRTRSRSTLSYESPWRAITSPRSAKARFE